MCNRYVLIQFFLFLFSYALNPLIIYRVPDTSTEIFLTLYTLEQERESVTYSKIAKFLCIPSSLVQNYIINLIEKGIPIYKKYLDKEVYLRLSPQFRELQAKKNLVKINESVSKKIVSPK